MTYVSNIDAVIGKLQQGIDAALTEMVKIPVAATQKDLAHGFKGGKETSGKSAKSIKATEVRGDYQFGRFITYGTDLFWHRFWTFGGMNAFTRQFERVDLYTPNFYENQGPMLAAAQKVLAEALK